MQLSSFVDPTNNQNFSPVKLNDLMTITVNENAAAADKNLVECSSSDPDLIAAVRNYRYEDPDNPGQYLTKDLYSRYKRVILNLKARNIMQ